MPTAYRTAATASTPSAAAGTPFGTWCFSNALAAGTTPYATRRAKNRIAHVHTMTIRIRSIARRSMNSDCDGFFGDTANPASADNGSNGRDAHIRSIVKGRAGAEYSRRTA